MGLLQLGFITIFLSEPLVSGYTTGAACHVFTSQLRHITGIDVDVPPGIFRVPRVSGWVGGWETFTIVIPMQEVWQGGWNSDTKL